jgi:ABC-2 type transport system permease protein
VTAIAGNEVRVTFLSAFGIGTAAGFAALAGALLIFDLSPGVARFDAWFASLFVVVGLFASLVTMRALAEEERSGTLELLLTGPVTTGRVIIGKLLGAVAVLALVTIFTFVCPLAVATMAHPDFGPIVTGYLGVIVVGSAFVSVGIAVSAATGNPLISAVATAAILLALWFGGVVGGGLTGAPRAVLDYFSPASHVTGFLRGTISAADLTYFASVIVVGVASAVAVVEARR